MRKLHETERAPPKCRTFALDFLFRFAQTIISYFASLKLFRNQAIFDMGMKCQLTLSKQSRECLEKIDLINE